MTTALDTALRKVAVGVARALGTEVTVRIVSFGAYSTASGGGTDTTSDTDVAGFVVSERELDAYGLAKVADRAVAIPAASVSSAPTSSDRFLVGSDVYEIAHVDPIRVRDLPALYVLHGRGPA